MWPRMAYVFADAPRRIYWEITRACSLACRHCRAEAQRVAAKGELTTDEGLALLDALAGFGEPLPHLVLTGGDPLERADLMTLLARANDIGFDVSLSPAATPLLSPERLVALKGAGVAAMSLSLDGSTAALHDGLRGVPGTYARTLESARRIVSAKIPLQINTLVTVDTAEDLEAIDRVVTAIGAQRWSLFFLVTVGRGKLLRQLTPGMCEALFSWILARSARPGPIITTTEAPHYRRVLLEHKRRAGHGDLPLADGGRARAAAHRSAFGIRDGNGILFVGHDGDVCPSGFLPLVAGNVRTESPVRIYRDAPLFRSLRDTRAFAGKCGVCEYHDVCGGSRARAWSATGSPVASDPLCLHEPAGPL